MASRHLKEALARLDSLDSSHLFKRFFDSLIEHVALLDVEGNIVATNKSWNKFSSENSGIEACRAGTLNYIKVSESAVGNASEEARQVAEGLRKVLSGKVSDFKIEYPCHSASEKRWFLMYATPLSSNNIIDGAVVSHIPITERRLAEEALRESEERFSSAFKYAAIGMALVGTDGRFHKVNNSLCNLVKYSEAELLSKTFIDITYYEDLNLDLSYVSRMLNGEIRSYQMEKRYVTKHGDMVWVLLNVSTVWDNDGKPSYFISQIQDINERKTLEAELTKLATTDPLTGVPNRRHFLDKLLEELTRMKRLDTPLCVAMIDIDNFKHINDTYGHETGDKILKSMAIKSIEILREVDSFGRIGGEEFAVTFVQVNQEAAFQAAERLRMSLSKLKVKSGDKDVHFTVSIGLHMVSKGETVDEVMKFADVALYKAKQSGRNQVCVNC